MLRYDVADASDDDFGVPERAGKRDVWLPHGDSHANDSPILENAVGDAIADFLQDGVRKPAAAASGGGPASKSVKVMSPTPTCSAGGVVDMARPPGEGPSPAGKGSSVGAVLLERHPQRLEQDLQI